MPDGQEPSTIKVLSSLRDIPAAQWDRCAGVANPFVSHGFLDALERSGSVTADTGWLPQHLAVEDDSGDLVACAPLYMKGHSYGEYIFDWAWADAYQRAGGRYYPKLLSAVPFTPASGPRLLVRPDAPAQLADILAAGMVELANRTGVSSVHINFLPQAEWKALGEAGFLCRTGHQYHWENRGYATFDDFLTDLSSRKRKAIRKERRGVADSGIEVLTLRGSDIKEHHWDIFFRFYLDTSDRKWGSPYLNREFFSLMHAALGDRVVLFLAEADGRTVAGALNLVGSDTLFGRYWGCVEAFKFLHFETCYYRAIDFAIDHRLQWVEAGAQGPHKIQRGYLPRPVYSVHWLADANFRDAVDRFLASERRANEVEIRELMAQSPFKRGDES